MIQSYRRSGPVASYIDVIERQPGTKSTLAWLVDDEEADKDPDSELKKSLFLGQRGRRPAPPADAGVSG
jgi:hypothetical protein